MFRIVRDPSSGSIKLYLTEIPSGSLMFVLCLIGDRKRNFLTSCVCVCVCVCGTTVLELLSSSQTVVPYTHTHARTHTTGSKITLPNTDQAYDKHQWTTMNFSQVHRWVTLNSNNLWIFAGRSPFVLRKRMTESTSYLAGLWICPAISNISDSNKAGSTTVKRARLTGKGSRSTAVLPKLA